jgi:hypothetical protein
MKDFIKFVNQSTHSFEVMLTQVIELLDVRKNFNQFLESLDKEIEFVENLGL